MGFDPKKVASLSRPTSNPSSRDSSYIEDGNVDLETRKNITVIETPKNSNEQISEKYIIQPQINSLTSKVTGKGLLKRKNGTIMNTLVNRKRDNLGGKIDTKTKRKRISKKDVYIAEFDNEDQLTKVILESNRDADVMDEFDIGELKENSKRNEDRFNTFLKEKMRKQRHEEKSLEDVSSRFIQEQINKVKEKIVDDSIEDLLAISAEEDGADKGEEGLSKLATIVHNKSRHDKIKYEMETLYPFISSNAIKSVKNIKEIVRSYKPLLEDILHGKKESHFYQVAKNYKEQNKQSKISITDEELIGIPKNRYFGYFGTLRGFKIGKYIEIMLSDLLKEKRRSNPIVNYWTISGISQYVLAPEIISRLISTDAHIELESTYSLMKETNLYGLLVTDNIPLIEDEDLIDENFETENGNETDIQHNKENVGIELGDKILNSNDKKASILSSPIGISHSDELQDLFD